MNWHNLSEKIKTTTHNVLLEYFYKDKKRRDCINEVGNESLQILENWALCWYCCNVNQNIRTYHHWRGELLTHCDEVIKTIKRYNFDYKKILVKGLLDRRGQWENAIKGKFSEEKDISHKFNKTTITEIIEDYIHNLDNLITSLANDSINKFIDDIFPQ